MFYDERIEQERGKIAKGAMLIATLYALMCGVLRFLNVALNMDHAHTYPKSYYFLPVGFEVTVALAGLVCLSVCALSGRGTVQDERTLTQRAMLYRKAGQIHLAAAVIALAVFFPLSLLVATNINFMAVDTLSVALHLFLLLAAWVAFSCKERQIFLNYAAQESHSYGRGVLKGIGRLAALVASALCLSIFITALSDLFLHSSRTASTMLLCALFWCAVLVLLTATYALLSLLERISYLKRRVLSGATFLTLLLVILLKCTYSTIELLLVAGNATMAEQLTTLNLFAFLPVACGFWFCLFLIYYHSEFRESGNDRLSRIGFLLVLFAEVPGGLADFLLSLLQVLFQRQLMENIEINLLFGELNGWQMGLTHAVFLAGFFLLIAGPVRRGLVGRWHVALALLLSAVALGVEIFLYTQIPLTVLSFVSDALSLARHLYLLIFLKHAQKQLDTPLPV